MLLPGAAVVTLGGLPLPAAAQDDQAAVAAVGEFLANVEVYAVTDESGAPVLEEEFGSSDAPGGRVGRFYLDEADANEGLARARGLMVRPLEVRKLLLSDVYLSMVAGGDTAQLGGHFRLEAPAAEMRNAEKLLGVQSMGPPGVVPLFFCPSLEVGRGADETRVPAFLHEADLRETIGRADIAESDRDVVVTTLDSVVSELLKPEVEQSPAARVLLAVGDVREIGLGKWR